MVVGSAWMESWVMTIGTSLLGCAAHRMRAATDPDGHEGD
jgi:hypothetical protein